MEDWGKYSVKIKVYQTFMEGVMPILYNLFQKTEAERLRPNSSYESSITLISKVKILQEGETKN